MVYETPSRSNIVPKFPFLMPYNSYQFLLIRKEQTSNKNNSKPAPNLGDVIKIIAMPIVSLFVPMYLHFDTTHNTYCINYRFSNI